MPFRVRRASELDSLKRGDQVEFQLVVKRTNFTRRKGAGRNERRSSQCPAWRSAACRFRLLPRNWHWAAGAGFSLGEPICPAGSSVRFCRSDHCGEFHLHALPAPGSLSAVVGQFRASAEAIPRANGTGSCSSIRHAGLSARHAVCIGRLCEAVGCARADGNFLLATQPDIQRLASQLGLVYWPEDGLLTHTSQTGIISRDGRLSALIEGSSYEEDQLGDLIARQLEVSHDSNRRTLDVAR